MISTLPLEPVPLDPPSASPSKSASSPSVCSDESERMRVRRASGEGEGKVGAEGSSGVRRLSGCERRRRCAALRGAGDEVKGEPEEGSGAVRSRVRWARIKFCAYSQFAAI